MPRGRTIDICVHDRHAQTSRVLGQSRAWNFQQGSMTQWLSLDGEESVVRCGHNLHPRWSPDGLRISIDSAHEGFRGTYVVDVSRLVE
jgi:Tol biopolymer transport system component